MVGCKNYMHAKYLLSYNLVGIKYYDENLELKQGEFTLSGCKEIKYDNIHNGNINVENVNGNKIEINYYGIVYFKILKKLREPIEKITQVKLKEINKKSIENNIGENVYIKKTMDQFKEIMENNVLEIKLIKLDGGLRTLVGSFNDWNTSNNLISKFKEKEKYGNIVVYDLDKHSYRTVRFLSIIEIKKYKARGN